MIIEPGCTHFKLNRAIHLASGMEVTLAKESPNVYVKNTSAPELEAAMKYWNFT